MTPEALNDALGHAAADKRLEVLRGVALSGSISQAAREAGISYKAAWLAIDTLTSLSGAVLVDRTVGGSGGGGAQITPQGLQLLALSVELAKARQQVLTTFKGGVALIGGLGLRTSMRNQLPCTVVGFLASGPDGIALSVDLRTPGGHLLAASLTQDSVDLLGLVKGSRVMAMCKATAVSVCGPLSDRIPVPPHHDALVGSVVRVAGEGRRDEVMLALPGGGHWVGFAVAGWTPGEGEEALAVMPRSALVVGVNSPG